MHLVDRLLDSVLLCLLADFGRLSADGVHLVVHSCCGQVLLLPYVCNHSSIKDERVVEVLVIRFEVEVFLILKVNLLLREDHSSLIVCEKLTLALLFLWQVLRHRTDLASSRGLLAAS